MKSILSTFVRSLLGVQSLQSTNVGILTHEDVGIVFDSAKV